MNSFFGKNYNKDDDNEITEADYNFLTGSNFKNNNKISNANKTKVKFLLAKKAELDYLFLPEEIRKQKEKKKINICGIVSMEKGEKCSCLIF